MAETTRLAAPRPVKRPWWRRRRYVVAMAALLLVAAYATAIAILDYLADRRYRAAVAEADRLDPGWRTDDLMARLAPIPDDGNSALRVMEVADALPADWPRGVVQQDERLNQWNDPAERLSPAELARHRKELDPVAELVDRARALADWPRGRYPEARPIVRRPEPVPGAGYKEIRNPSPGEVASARVGHLLWHDATLRAEAGDIEGALTSARALLNVGRSLGDVPSLYDQQSRSRTVEMALGCLARALARGEASEMSLAAFQALLEDEAAQPIALIALRGERAATDELLNRIDAGKVSRQALPIWGQKFTFALLNAVISRRTFRDNQTQLLRRYNAVVEVARGPEAEQLAKMEAMAAAYAKARNAMTAWEKLQNLVELALSQDAFELERFFRLNQAVVRTAAVAVAAERFRLARGRWPDSYDELVPSFLARVPDDPFAAGPIRRKRLPDGLFVYSVGSNEHDDGGTYDPNDPAGARGDVGFRLWDPDHRPPTGSKP